METYFFLAIGLCLIIGFITIIIMLNLILEHLFHFCPECATRPVKLITHFDDTEIIIYFCPECRNRISYKRVEYPKNTKK